MTSEHGMPAAMAGWQERASCRSADPELWFPEPWEGDRAAKLICGWCPVRAECLTVAMETNEQYGVWGGLSPNERRRLIRRDRESAPLVVAVVGGDAA
jgi:WhiB family redox-sensing transcriptional regulator